MVSILIYSIKITAVLKKYINYEYNYSYLQRIVYSKIEATVQIDFILYVLCNFIRLFDEFSTWFNVLFHKMSTMVFVDNGVKSSM